jgi:hypothetical protein
MQSSESTTHSDDIPSHANTPSLLSVEESISELREINGHCEDFAEAEALCRATRNLWSALHQRALYNPMLLSSSAMTQAEKEIQKGITAIAKADLLRKPNIKLSEEERQKLQKFPQSMKLRCELVGLLQKGGISAVDKRLEAFVKD